MASFLLTLFTIVSNLSLTCAIVLLHWRLSTWFLGIEIYQLVFFIIESKQQSEQQDQQAADKEEGIDLSKMTTVVDVLQQSQSSKTVEMVCSIQNIVNALHAIIVSSVSTHW